MSAIEEPATGTLAPARPAMTVDQTRDEWMAFVQQHKSLPLKPRPGIDAEPIKVAERSRSYRLTVETLQNIQVPAKLLQIYETPLAARYFFRTTFFHMGYKAFFGATFQSDYHQDFYQGSNERIHNVTIKEPVYFHSSYADERMVAVVEVVLAVSFHADGKNMEESYGVGFAVIPLFADLRNIPDSRAAAPVPTVAQLYSGSPRILLAVENFETKLTRLPGGLATYTFAVHQPLDEFTSLTAENTLFGIYDRVPGIKNKVVRTAENPDMIGAAVTNFDQPVGLKTRFFHLHDIRVNIPDGFETALVTRLKAMWAHEEDVKMDDLKADVVVKERRLHCGVHNGRRYVDTPHMVALNTIDKLEMAFSGVISLGGVALDSLYAIVIIIEYQVTMPALPNKKKKKKGVATREVALDQPIAVSWYPYMTFVNGALQTGPVDINLLHGPRTPPTDSLLLYNCLAPTAKTGTDPSEPIRMRFTIKESLEGPPPVKPAPQPVPAAAPAPTPAPAVPAPTALVQPAVVAPAPITPAPAPQPTPALRPAASVVARGTPGMAAAEPEVGMTTYGSIIAPRDGPNASRRGMRDERFNDTMDAMDVTDMSATRGLLGPAAVPARGVVTTFGLTGMTRAAKAKLLRANFPEIRDRHGKMPIDISPVASAASTVPASYATNVQTGPLNLDLEARDPLQANVVHMQFLAFTPDIDDRANNTSLQKAFFSFQFYRFPYLTTERLAVFGDATDNDEERDAPRILLRLNQRGEPGEEPGLDIKYVVDPSYRPMGEGANFASYLHDKVLHIDVWDGETMLLRGTAAVPMRRLLRQGREAVQFTDRFPIVFSDLGEDVAVDSATSAANGRRTVRGYLHMRLACVGNVAEPSQQDVMYGTLVQGLDLQRNRTGKRIKERIPLMTERDAELRALLEQRRASAGAAGATDLERRIESVKKGRASTSMTAREVRTEREKEMKTIDMFRQRRKRATIVKKLQSSLTSIHRIFPAFGVACFFEYELINPYDEKHVFKIEFDDPELRLVENFDEWIYFKQAFGVHTPAERDYLENKTIHLDPRERVYIPFVFQSFNCGQQPAMSFEEAMSIPYDRATDDQGHEPIRAREVRVNFANMADKSVAMMTVEVCPQQFIVDQTHRFNSTENEFLKKTLLIDTQTSHARRPQQARSVRCSNTDVICGMADEAHSEQLFLKFNCGPAPSQAQFYVVVYNDKFMATVLETWQIFVQSLHRLDLTAMLGQTTDSSFVVRGTSVTSTVQCFTNSQELQIKPPTPFQLTANGLSEVGISFRPRAPGRHKAVINVVDVESHRLISAWLVSTVTKNPEVTKYFELKLRSNKASNKQISYRNYARTRERFRLHTNRADLLEFREPILELDPDAEGSIGLRFLPCSDRMPRGSAVEILVFVNDMRLDKNIECLCLNATYE